jgi:hypothetical protein
VFDSSSCAGTVASSGPSGWCLRDLFLCSSFFSPLAKRLFLFLQTFVVPEWEPVGTAVFVPLAASGRRGVTRALIGGGGAYIHIFVFCPTNFF